MEDVTRNPFKPCSGYTEKSKIGQADSASLALGAGVNVVLTPVETSQGLPSCLCPCAQRCHVLMLQQKSMLTVGPCTRNSL